MSEEGMDLWKFSEILGSSQSCWKFTESSEKFGEVVGSRRNFYFLKFWEVFGHSQKFLEVSGRFWKFLEVQKRSRKLSEVFGSFPKFLEVLGSSGQFFKAVIGSLKCNQFQTYWRRLMIVVPNSLS